MKLQRGISSIIFRNWRRSILFKRRNLDPNELISRGDRFLCLAQLDDALRCYREASRQIYQSIDISKKEGMVLGMMGRYMEAIAAFDRALEVDPYDFEVYMHRGFNLWRLQRWKEALINFEKAIFIKPDDEYARHCRKLSKVVIYRNL